MEMPMSRRIPHPMILAILPAALAAGAAMALDTSLDRAAIETAMEEGRTQAETRGQGYQVQDYVLWDREEPLHISPQAPLIDAVIVSTPTERLLYQAYLQAFQGKDWSYEEAEALAQEMEGTVGFRIFAHAPSGGPEDRDFLDRFGEARLVLEDGRTLRSEVDETSSPATDFFITEDGRHVFRWLGTVSYRFDIAQDAKADGDLEGRLEVDGPQGEVFTYDVDLALFR
jgi:hypothetical protein